MLRLDLKIQLRRVNLAEKIFKNYLVALDKKCFLSYNSSERMTGSDPREVILFSAIDWSAQFRF